MGRNCFPMILTVLLSNLNAAGTPCALLPHWNFTTDATLYRFVHVAAAVVSRHTTNHFHHRVLLSCFYCFILIKFRLSVNWYAHTVHHLRVNVPFPISLLIPIHISCTWYEFVAPHPFIAFSVNYILFHLISSSSSDPSHHFSSRTTRSLSHFERTIHNNSFHSYLFLLFHVIYAWYGASDAHVQVHR